MALSGLRHNYRNNSTTTTTNTNTGRRNRTSKRRAPVNPERRQRRDQRREQARREQAAEAHQPQAQPQEHGVDEAGARGGDPQTQLDQQMADLEIPAEAGDRQVVVLPPPDRR
ncbi:uncharacterized protein TRUGW13939_11458 [Talaromyces rugulosus]|uniref:Uncharacterized protein n=1 Tax=Talaromyces rugulosus TaxID=121627 RepID=A0A7H8RFE6_TALRU|nr:uncharacterized protein TRUGW13939_11458 [Talaromyces rugulosus]QKX64285.1 hypothetical protein TRUGW13939_11458 [Talaromyces rugulosus]